MNRICLCLSSLLLTCQLFAASAFAADDPYAGDYRAQVLKVEITPKDGAYSGTIKLGVKEYPLTARVDGNQLRGAFVSEGKAFDFTANRDGDTLTLRTGTAVYVLTRQAAAAPRAEAAAQRAKPEEFIRLTRVKILDPMSNNDPAYTILMPTDWKMDGSVVWRWNAYAPTTLNVRLFNPKGAEQMVFYPSLVFVDGVREATWQAAIIAGPEVAQRAIAAFPEGGFYGGFEIRRRMTDPAKVLQTYGLPRLRKDLANLKPIDVAEMPELTKAAAAPYANVAGAEVKVVRVRYAYELQGTAVEEDFYCTLASAPTLPPMSAWGMEIQSFRAEKGKLDEKMRLFQAMNRSATMDLKWFAGVQSVQQMMHEGNMKAAEDAGRLSRYIAQRNEEITQIIRDTYQTRQASQDRVYDAWSQAIRGVQRYVDPHNPTRPLELPNGYEKAYMSNRGEIILSNNPNFNPAVAFQEDWRELPKAKP